MDVDVDMGMGANGVRPDADNRHQQVTYSLQCRGKHVEDMNKTELLDLLYDDIVLETKVL